MSSAAARPIAFVVMPFGTKPTGLPAGKGPKTVDFDAVYRKIHCPVLTALGYEPVRADQDMGGIIVVDMLERLAVSDAVVVDISIANANVYYELGVRHAMHRTHCALVAADWAQPLFDLRQVPRLPYPLAGGRVSDKVAEAAREALKDQLHDALDQGISPVFRAINGYPNIDPSSQRASELKDEVRKVEALNARIHAVGEHYSAEDRRKAAQALFDEVAPAGDITLRRGVWLDLMAVARDALGWDELLAWIERMPDSLKADPYVEEQRLLAVAQAGAPTEASSALRMLIKKFGATSERWGLLGGRYKRAMLAAREAGKEDEAQARLDDAIDAYEQGMLADLNDYYPSSNLPRLYRERGHEEDEQKARYALAVATQAADRAAKLKLANEWTNATRLGLAFELPDPVQARKLLREARRELDNLASWKLESTLADLELSLARVADPAVKSELAKVLDDLRALATN